MDQHPSDSASVKTVLLQGSAITAMTLHAQLHMNTCTHGLWASRCPVHAYVLHWLRASSNTQNDRSTRNFVWILRDSTNHYSICIWDDLSFAQWADGFLHSDCGPLILLGGTDEYHTADSCQRLGKSYSNLVHRESFKEQILAKGEFCSEQNCLYRVNSFYNAHTVPTKRMIPIRTQFPPHWDLRAIWRLQLRLHEFNA
jgi:hypothetical protein